VEKPVIYPYFGRNSWSEAWANLVFRRKLIGALVLFTALMLLLPYFFAIIETRPGGLQLNDWLLAQIPSQDCSVTIFIFLWSTSLLMVFRSIQQPAFFLTALSLLIAITLVRMLTISLIPLDPPAGLIHLKDPLTSLTYGGRQVFITRDLFFSGHTANIFMFYLCLQKRRDKQFALLATIVIATLVLVQHIHYSVDVVAAFVFTYLIVHFTKKSGFLQV
jgi:hypothetical protein